MKKYRIGGDFEITQDLILTPSCYSINSTITNSNATFLDIGRSAIYVILLEILKHQSIKKVWLPYYACHTITAPFEQLNFDIHFYSMGEDLSSPKGLPEKLDDSILLFIHYFGKKNQSLVSFIEEKRAAGFSFFVIEDCVQTCLSQVFGSCGDFVIHSLRKFLPVPDGAIIESENPLHADLGYADESFISEKLLAKLIRGSNGDPQTFLSLYQEAEEKKEDEIVPRQMSRFSEYILQKLNLEEIADKRRKNWNLLSVAFEKATIASDIINPLYSNMNRGEVPLAFPVVVKHKLRNQLKAFLAEYNIFCPIHWDLNQKYLNELCKDDYCLSQSILSIPIDQRVSANAMDYLIKTLNQFNKVTI